METVDLITRIQDVFVRLQVIQNLVYAGQCCPAYEKLQGAQVKCAQLLQDLGSEIGEKQDENVVDESPQDNPQDSPEPQ